MNGKEAMAVRSPQVCFHDRHGFGESLHDHIAGFGGLGFGGGRVLGHGEHGRCDSRDLGVVIEVKQPFAKPDVLPHEAFAGLLCPAADDGGDAVADAHDGAVHLMAKEARGMAVGADGFIGEPEFLAPDDLGLHVLGQLVIEDLLVDFHLASVFWAEQDFHSSFSDHSDDGGEKGSGIVRLHGVIARVLLGIERLAFDLPVGCVAEAGDAAHELAVFEIVRLEEVAGLIVGEVHRKSTIGAEFHDRALATVVFGELEGMGIAEIHELGGAEELDGIRSGRGEGDAVHAKGFAGFLVPFGDVLLGHKAGSRAVKKEVALGQGSFDMGWAFDDFHLGEAFLQHFFHAVSDVTGPEADLDAGEVLLKKVEHARGVSDIADVNRLPRRAQENPARALFLGWQGGECACEGGGEKVTAVHAGSGERVTVCKEGGNTERAAER